MTATAAPIPSGPGSTEQMMSEFTRSRPMKMALALPSSRPRVIAAVVIGLGVPLVGFSAWYLASHDLVIESGRDLVAPLSVVAAMLVLSVLVGWLLHDATRRAINRARVESALTLDRQVVVRMQRALLPTRLPKIEGVELEVRYRPGDLGATGGDWYAAIPLADRRVGLAVGEVEGEGVQAAARMAEVGFVLRGIASLGDAPDSVLEQLNQQLFALAGDTEPMHVSAIYGILDTDSGEWEYAMAGSCPPLLRGADAAVQTLEDEPASALGVDPNAKFHTTTVALSAGSTLLLYTNGLLERADEVTARDLQRLSAAFKVLDDDLTDGVDRLVRLMVGDDASEDSVVVAARVNKVPAVSTPG